MYKRGEAAIGLLVEHVWALSIKTRELISTRKRFSKLYKITLAFKNRQSVDRSIRGASWIWLKYTVTVVYGRPKKIFRLDRECLSGRQSCGRNRRMYKRGGRRWRKEGFNGMREE